MRRVIGLVSLAFGLALACSRSRPPLTPRLKEIVIGVIYPMTGNLAQLGLDSVTAAPDGRGSVQRQVGAQSPLDEEEHGRPARTWAAPRSASWSPTIRASRTWARPRRSA